MKSILFVCMGNICRSPAAEGIFRSLVAETGRQDEFTIDSAGTHRYHVGHPPDRRMREAAAHRGYRLQGVAREIRPDDFDRFDLIVVMDDQNLAEVNALDPGSRAKVVPLCAYCEQREEAEVPDPYYGDEAGFQRVIDILEDACAGLLKRL